MIVVDTNVIAYFCLAGPQTSAAKRLAEQDHDWRAPQLWRSEMRNILAGEMRRHGASLSQATRLFAAAEAVISRTHETDTDRVLGLLAASRCSAYDLEYIALAQELQTPLVTQDKELLRAFPEIARPLL